MGVYSVVLANPNLINVEISCLFVAYMESCLVWAREMSLNGGAQNLNCISSNLPLSRRKNMFPIGSHNSMTFWLSLPVHSESLKRIDYPK